MHETREIVPVVQSHIDRESVMRMVGEMRAPPEAYDRNAIVPSSLIEPLADAILALIKTPPAADDVERVAEKIYAAMKTAANLSCTDNHPDWEQGGNSLMQDEARRCASNILSAIRPRVDAGEGWRDIASAPRDGTMIRLLIDYADGGGPLEDAERAWTIGFNGFEDHGVDEWKFAGWCWTHDHFTQGSGVPVGWLPWSNPTTGGGE